MTEGELPKTLRCICCGAEMANFMEAERGYQPLEGLAFETRGHYGSTYFDPMDGTYLEICVCDACVEKAESEGRVYRGKPRVSSRPAAEDVLGDDEIAALAEEFERIGGQD